MSYTLVLSTRQTDDVKAVGENVFLDDLPAGYPVYLFYYPTETAAETLETGLRKLGERTGDNLYVNLGDLADPNLAKIAKVFKIRSFPAIVVTAVADLAGEPEEYLNTFVRFDAPSLRDEHEAIRLVEQVYLRYLQGEVKQAIWKMRRTTFSRIAKAVGEVLASALSKLATFIASRDITVSVLEGRFELKKSS